MAFDASYQKREPRHTKVAVLMGGWSNERPVSISTGQACTRALEEAGYEVTQIDVDRNITKVLSELHPDVAFNALHGTWGEDGHVQGVLETLQIPYTHSGVLASALAMDKQRSKGVFKEAGIPVAESRVVSLERAAEKHAMQTPYVIKPVADGSSVGVHIIKRGAKRPPENLLQEREIFGDEVMVERYIPGRELTCAVISDVSVGVIEIMPNLGFYDYKAKYEEGASAHVLPADIPKRVYRKVQEYSMAAHNALGCRGVSRADFRLDDTRDNEWELILLEVNTQPGMTPTSLVPELAQDAGHSFTELVHWMIQDASLER